MLRLDEMLKAAVESSSAMKSDAYESDSVHCPFYKRHGVSLYEYYAKNPKYGDRFAKGMSRWGRMEDSNIELRNSFPWARLKGTIVGIGGGSGHFP
ncbi:hypothetical protein GGS21DRAFT_521917 [Xylaria nigripes]|nr:hypothetical protein GGS21DRAFT_521917 [Xylaria nigripes]